MSPGKYSSMDEDMQNLRNLIPGLNKGDNVSQVEIMEEAAKYIDHLQNSLVCHIRTHGYPDTFGKSSNNSNSNNNQKTFSQDKQTIKRNVENFIVGKKK